MNSKTLLGLVILVSGCLVAGVAPVLPRQNFNIPWQVLASGGGRTTSSQFSLWSTLGQGPIGSSSSSNYQAHGGFGSGVLRSGMVISATPSPTTAPMPTPTRVPSITATYTLPPSSTPTQSATPLAGPTLTPTVTPAPGRRAYLPLIRRTRP